ncbi:MAG: glyoxalase [Bacteroidetes bacterium]|jgi:catechol 2,3-dioxygenase-like lactoylglutathione lyase family enzyme|nr:glyoxalase [Bacteroidota bacterium]
MIRAELIIGVKDVQESSKWYQGLLSCKSNHGGDTFEILANPDGSTILCLHKWGEHEHPTITDPAIQPGNGLIVYLRIDDLKTVWEKAQELNAVIEQPPHVNENSGMEEFAIRDPDGYYLLISL